MKNLITLTLTVTAMMFLAFDYAAAQITVNSILVAGTARTDGANSFPSDSDSFSLNSFTDAIEVSAQSGILLNASLASAGAKAEFDGSSLAIETFVNADQLSSPFTADATATVEVLFSLGSSFDVVFSSDVFSSNFIGTRFDGNIPQLMPNELWENAFIRTDDQAVFTENAGETFRVEPGNYLLRSTSNTFADDNSFFGHADTSASITFTAVPEPSSLSLVCASFLAMISRRKRVAMAVA